MIDRHDQGEGGEVFTGAHGVCGVGLADMATILAPGPASPIHTFELFLRAGGLTKETHLKQTR